MPPVRALATDGVVLLERDHPPHEGSWVLPGGLVEPDETAAAACAREVQEGVGLDVRPVAFIGLYDAPDRDERGNASAAYLCVLSSTETPEPREEARRVDTVAPDDLADRDLGFDHGRVVSDALAVER